MKKTIILVLLLCLAACLWACDDPTYIYVPTPNEKNSQTQWSSGDEIWEETTANSTSETPTGETCVELTEPTEIPTSTEPTEISIPTEPVDEKIVYTILVLNERGEPIPGVMVSLCNAEIALPCVTDENGMVTESAYAERNIDRVTIGPCPDGYAAQTKTYYFPEGSCEMTIVLESVK